MSGSPVPAESSDGGPPAKRRRGERSQSTSSHPFSDPSYLPDAGPSHPPNGHIPKRGSRACTNCRRGKNRCEFEGDAPCRRCILSGLQCVFEKPEKKPSVLASPQQLERVSHLENQFVGMQSQIVGMQSSLDRILQAIQGGMPQIPQQHHSAPVLLPPFASNGHHISRPFSPHGGAGPQSSLPMRSPRDLPFPSPSSTHSMVPSSSGRAPSMDPSHPFFPELPAPIPPVGSGASRPSSSAGPAPIRTNFPPLPGFAPPPHKFATYGIVPSTAPSSDDESEDTLPRAKLNAPIEALQGLANAAAEAAAASITSPRRSKILNPKRVEPIPRNAFPNVIDKGLVAETEARELYNVFFSGCHLFIPLFDPTYDTFDSLRSRTPFCFDSILAVASKIRAGSGPPSETFHRCLEEAQGIARSTLFGPVVRKEAVQAMLLLAAWSTSGWLPSGHAMRMALDLGLHRALEKLADSPYPSAGSVAANESSPGGSAASPASGVSSSGKRRSEDEERDLVVSARIWLCLYWFDHQMSLGTGRPVVLRDENTIKHCRILLSHPMSTPTDVRLVSLIELMAQKSQIHETLLASQNGPVNSNTLAFVRRANVALDKWWTDCDELHRSMEPDSLLRTILRGDLHYAKLWLVCTVLRGASWDKMTFEQRELAFQAKEAASECLNIFLGSPDYRSALRYAIHDALVTAAFSGLFLLKVANLFPREVDLAQLTVQVEQLAQLFSDVAAERYALTLRLMIVNLRRKLGMGTGQHTPLMRDDHPITPLTGGFPSAGELGGPEGLTGGGGTLPPITIEDLDFSWPSDMMFSPTSIPTWLQETNLSDLSLPINGSDGVFLPMGMSSLWPGDMPGYQAW